MPINYLNEDVDFPKFDLKKTSNWIQRVAATYHKKIGTVNYNFCSDKRILEVNKQYLQHDYYTDIITFDYSNDNVLSGDIYISVDMVKYNSQEFNIPFTHELHRVLIHGVLHLCGQNDKTEQEQAEMTIKENKALEIL